MLRWKLFLLDILMIEFGKHFLPTRPRVGLLVGMFVCLFIYSFISICPLPMCNKELFRIGLINRPGVEPYKLGGIPDWIGFYGIGATIRIGRASWCSCMRDFYVNILGTIVNLLGNTN